MGPTEGVVVVPTTLNSRKLSDPTADDDRVAALEVALREKEAELSSLQRNHDEYVRSSVEIEHELETEVHRIEAVQRKTDELLQKAMADARTAQDATATATKEVLQLQGAVADLANTTAALKAHIQRLEQANDDLERRERELQATVTDLEQQLDDAVEQTVFLQQELDDLCKQGPLGRSVSAPQVKDAGVEKASYHAMPGTSPAKSLASIPGRFFASAKSKCAPACTIM
ncbi:hypothetical protein ACHHYP_03687 [Achlya hypogyna]|uniref:Uncharacterized protein n=1 Tax=Achlya hypogyna TaxID=1202772 RepID=A0A1V9Z375_ACHHY|nr:hypothetical protein ACHHYP_03687 [Achlya hypogyna]